MTPLAALPPIYTSGPITSNALRETARLYPYQSTEVTTSAYGVPERRFDRRFTAVVSPSKHTITELEPFDRWVFLARTDRLSFVLLVVSAIASLCAVAYLIGWTCTEILGTMAPPAHATSRATSSASAGGSLVDYWALGMLTLFSSWALLTISFSKNKTAVQYAFDISKITLGCAAGYFGGARGR